LFADKSLILLEDLFMVTRQRSSLTGFALAALIFGLLGTAIGFYLGYQVGSISSSVQGKQLVTVTPLITTVTPLPTERPTAQATSTRLPQATSTLAPRPTNTPSVTATPEYSLSGGITLAGTQKAGRLEWYGGFQEGMAYAVVEKNSEMGTFVSQSIWDTDGLWTFMSGDLPDDIDYEIYLISKQSIQFDMDQLNYFIGTQGFTQEVIPTPGSTTP
jgi:hypothetical protein